MVVVLLMAGSTISLFTPQFYKTETLNWKIQSIGQDLINLILIVPVLIICITFDSVGNKLIPKILAGTHLYLVYTFIIYCFNIHFNSLFLLYVAVLGLSFYSALNFLYRIIKENETSTSPPETTTRYCGIYFIVISVLFFITWMSRIVPPVVNAVTPGDLAVTGLFTNPVHVLDLAIFLPAFFMVGVSLLKRNPVSINLAPVLLAFSMLMDLTIAGLAIILKFYKQEDNITIVFIMGIVTLTGLVFIFLFSKKRSTR